MKPQILSLKLISIYVTLLLMVALSINPVFSATPPAWVVMPVISNSQAIALVGGSTLTAVWPVPAPGIYTVWVQVPITSTASNAAYSVYPQGNPAGNSQCSSTDRAHPCFQVVVNQATASKGWVQLTVNNQATTTWQFAPSGFVSTTANKINRAEQLGVAQVSFQSLVASPPSVLTIRQTYQGGKIFHIDATGQHGLIVAPSDQSAGMTWYNGIYLSTGAIGTAIGTGPANTIAIVNTQGKGSYAAQMCDDLVLNGYSDWYLPSQDELNQLYAHRYVVGIPTDYSYWSSSEYDSSIAKVQDFDNSYQYSSSKDDNLPVRCIRTF